MSPDKPEIILEPDQIKVVAERDVDLFPDLSDDELGRRVGIGPTPKIEGLWFFRIAFAFIAVVVIFVLGGAFFGAFPLF